MLSADGGHVTDLLRDGWSIACAQSEGEREALDGMGSSDMDPNNLVGGKNEANAAEA